MRRTAWFTSLLVFLLAMGMVFATMGKATAQTDPEPTPAPAPQRSNADSNRRIIGDDVADTPVEMHEHHEGDGQHGGSGGHLEKTSKNVGLVSKLKLSNVEEGLVADVTAFGNYAYLASFSSEDCSKGGFWVVDISDPTAPREVAFQATQPGSYVGEGMQVLRIDTPKFTGDVLAINNEICSADGSGIGGVSLWDVSDPANPEALVEGFGDTTADDGTTLERANQIHSVRMWQAGKRAFAVIVDDEEIDDVDILEITDPRSPKVLVETGLANWPNARLQETTDGATFFHDVVIEQIDGTWTMLLSYWDLGWVLLNVDDPAKPRFIRDSEYPDPDTLSKDSPPEGNAHQAEWSASRKYIIGTDEDFSPERIKEFRITSGAGTGKYPAGIFGFGTLLTTLPDDTVNGPTVFGGYGCDAVASVIPAPSVLGTLASGEESILVLSRGPVADPNVGFEACTFVEKMENAAEAGYDAVVIANHHVGADAGAAPDAALCGSGTAVDIFGICVGHRALHLLFDRAPDYTVPYPEGDPGDKEPNPGDLGAKISASSEFDGWGYVRLLDATSLRERDAYAIPEGLDDKFASGFGDLSVHEVATDPEDNLAYFSYYAGGFRVAEFGPQGIKEVGAYIDEGGNNFWGVELHRLPNDPTREKLILASDRDYGLYIFRYTGPKPNALARLRAAHAVPDVAGKPVDVYIDAVGGAKGWTKLATFDFGDVTDYIGLEQGTYDVRVTAGGADPKQGGLITRRVSIGRGKAFTVVARGTAANDNAPLELGILKDDTAQIAVGKAGLRVRHLAPNAPAVDVYVNGVQVVGGLAYRDKSPYVTLLPGSYTIGVAPAGGAVIYTTNVTLTAGDEISAWPIGLLDGENEQAFRVIVVRDDL